MLCDSLAEGESDGGTSRSSRLDVAIGRSNHLLVIELGVVSASVSQRWYPKTRLELGLSTEAAMRGLLLT